jgi:hypothetical protein
MSYAQPAAHQPAAGLVKAKGTYGRPRVARPRRAWDAPRTSLSLNTYRGRRQRCSFGQQWSIHFLGEVGKIFLKFMQEAWRPGFVAGSVQSSIRSQIGEWMHYDARWPGGLIATIGATIE